ncbi:2-methylcitrate dehydratase [Salinarchaeum sp. Harcht-Bsk1]|uniref:MmgE/PrpD family protein n=1 Tax=Salinarchaeum sp. Harcht-Bsk1 TaxID=1333523 RepID=UPI000342345F|nr:MmgE/PrpD family protein [Salinarchaeum sp. Harcht-Bsk1]AGN01614.1 2-methylcitrate dehydratase [Salinarchaeum sp. Harcht-Bsk1]
MTTTGEIARFVRETEFDDLPDDVVDATKRRILDSVGIALGAVGAAPVEAVRRTVHEDGGLDCCMWASEGRASISGAAMYNTVLTRYLDFMDSFLAPGETPHPSDNVGTVLAVGEHVDASGEDLLAATAIAYQLQGELAWAAPVRDRGFDHVTHTVLTQAAAAGKLLQLDHEQLQHAIGIAGTAHNALRVTRTGGINEWKGVAAGNAARNGTYAALLASNGMEGPTDLFEGQKGWQQVISGGDFALDLDPPCPRLHDVMCKRYVAETYAQSAVEGIVELANTVALDPDAVESIDLSTFHGAKLIIGGGEGDRHVVETKAQADHSLPYMLAVAAIDRELLTRQYEPERIQSDDVQRLLRTVSVEEDPALTERFEAGEMPAVIDVELADGTVHHVEKDAFRGHPTDPMDWDDLDEKLRPMATDVYGEHRWANVTECVQSLEDRSVHDLLELLD